MTVEPGSPTDRLLTLVLILAPVVYLLADTLYAVRGWDDPTAAVVHVLAATGYGLVLIRWVTWSDARPTLAVALLVVGIIGLAGNVAYGFNTIHVSLGDTDLVDASGAANLIKPYGLFFPLSLLLAAVSAWSIGWAPRWAAALLGVAGVLWPVAHIANIGALAVLVNVALVVVCLATRYSASSDARLDQVGAHA